jgi:large subunit ribosomal protein L21
MSPGVAGRRNSVDGGRRLRHIRRVREYRKVPAQEALSEAMASSRFAREIADKSARVRSRRHRARKNAEGSAMYAVIKTGGKQYRVAENDILEIERLAGDAGSSIEFTEVLMVGEGDSVKVGKPTIAGAKVSAELVEQTRGPKLIAFKKRRRKNSRRKKGHRQDLTKVRITGIMAA